MADNQAPAPAIKALVVANPGDPITAGRWNEMQCQLRSEHVQHAHTGTWKGELYDGAPISAAGLADNAVITSRIADKAVTGDKVDPTTSVTVRELTATGKLRATTLELTEATAIALPAHDLKFGHSTRHGSAAGRALADLARIDGDRDILGINFDSDWKDGVKICSDLQVAGKTTLGGELIATTVTVNGTLTAKSGASVAGALTVGNGLTVSGSALTAKNGAALSGTVTASNGLTVTGALLTASHGLTVTGSLNATGGLAVTGGPLSAASGLNVTGNSTFVNHVTVNGNLTTNNSQLSVSSGLYVSGATNLQGELTVLGRSNFKNTPTFLNRAMMCGDISSSQPKIIAGHVTYSGSSYNTPRGGGFSVAAYETNACKITFTRAWATAPMVIVQQIGAGNTKDNALVLAADVYSIVVYTGNGDGNRERRDFYFIAYGEANND